MVCQACGAAMSDDVHFCSRCGARVASAPPLHTAYPPPVMMYQPRVQRHLQTLGILWCVFGAYRIVKGLMGMVFLKAVTMHGFGGNNWIFAPLGSFGAPWLSSLLPFMAAYTVAIAALSVFVGYSLITHRQWGRTLAIVVGILTLLKPILGTALGIYTLWVLAPELSGEEYDEIAARA